MRCPICKKEVAVDDAEMPFCSKRCRLLDLGDWAAGKYVISTPIQSSEFQDSDESEAEPEEGSHE